MLFTSLTFWLFFCGVLLLHYVLPARHRTAFLLLVSLGYCLNWRWEFCLLLIGQLSLHYFCAGKLAMATTSAQRRGWYVLALSGTLLFLLFFKYYNFFNDSFASLLAPLNVNYLLPHLDLILPIGISFYSFQLIGYTSDVFKNKYLPEKNFLNFALFASFFPQLTSGPIPRGDKLLPQFRRPPEFSAERLLGGLQLIVWGLFKKVVVADRLASFVGEMYHAPANIPGATLLLASYFFTFQIYCDFSGYSDIAVGLGRVLGYELPQNFNLPYFSRSLNEFWKRWHISLTSWFRDYVYIPLGGNRVSQRKWLCNIMVVFLLSGLWHGASWTFIIWGGIHGLYYLTEHLLGKHLPKFKTSQSWAFVPLCSALKVVWVFHIVTFAWIFFRAPSLDTALTVIHRIFTSWGYLYTGMSQLTPIFGVGGILALLAFECAILLGCFSDGYSRDSRRCPGWLTACAYAVLMAGIALFGITSNTFVYLQF